jgi:lupus La protein
MDSVTKFLNADPKPQWNGQDLLTMSKDAYCEMKIKEKGLTGKAAQYNRFATPSRKGFNAFAKDDSKEKANKEKAEKSKHKEKPEIYLEFLGARLKVNQDDGGSVEESEIPFVKGASLKFTGCGGDLKFAEVKVCFSAQFLAHVLITSHRSL